MLGLIYLKLTTQEGIVAKSIIYQKVLARIIRHHQWKKLSLQTVDSDIKRYEEIKLTTGQSEDKTTGCLLNYEYIKNHYRLIAVDLSRQNELDADPKVIQEIEFVRQLNN